MNPLSIKNLLARYAKTIRAPQGIIRTEVAKAYISLGVACTESDIAYTPTTRIATIVATGPKRTEMLLRKHAVLDALRRSLRTEDMPKDIV